MLNEKRSITMDAAPVGEAASTGTKGASEYQVSAKDAEILEYNEKFAQEQIAATLAAAGVPADADMSVKRAALVASMHDYGVKAATGVLLSLSPEVLQASLDGNFQKVAQDKTSGAMPPTVPTGDPAAAADADPAAMMGEDPTQMIREVLMAMEQGQISQEEMMQLLQELGASPEVLQELMAAMSGEGGVPLVPR